MVHSHLITSVIPVASHVGSGCGSPKLPKCVHLLCHGQQMSGQTCGNLLVLFRWKIRTNCKLTIRISIVVHDNHVRLKLFTKYVFFSCWGLGSFRFRSKLFFGYGKCQLAGKLELDAESEYKSDHIFWLEPKDSFNSLRDPLVSLSYHHFGVFLGWCEWSARRSFKYYFFKSLPINEVVEHIYR